MFGRKTKKIAKYSKDLNTAYANESVALLDVARIKARIESEYRKHVPDVGTDPLDCDYERLALGNTAHGVRFRCAAPGCGHMWPCPQWHVLRRIYGYDNATYNMKMIREEVK